MMNANSKKSGCRQCSLFSLSVLCIILTSCDFFPENNASLDSILGSAQSTIICENAEVHPYPVLFADEQLRPSGTGSNTYYGSLNTSYAESAELIWMIEVDSGSLGLTLSHDPSDDLDLFLLGSCTADSLIYYSMRRDTASEHFWYTENEGGIYYVVADGIDGQFKGWGATLSVVVLSSAVASSNP